MPLSPSPSRPLHTILVAYDGSVQADDLLRLACDTVGRTGQVIALYVTRIPSSVPLAPLPAYVDAAGNAALDHAERALRCDDSVIETRLARARRVADAIVGEAAASGADAIFLPLAAGRLQRRLRCAWQAWTVIRRAPCRVLLSYQPALPLGRALAGDDVVPDRHAEPRLLRKVP